MHPKAGAGRGGPFAAASGAPARRSQPSPGTTLCSRGQHELGAARKVGQLLSTAAQLEEPASGRRGQKPNENGVRQVTAGSRPGPVVSVAKAVGECKRRMHNHNVQPGDYQPGSAADATAACGKPSLRHLTLEPHPHRVANGLSRACPRFFTSASHIHSSCDLANSRVLRVVSTARIPSCQMAQGSSS